MNTAALAFAMLGLTGFALGAVLSATGRMNLGVILMGSGLVCQVISLALIKRARKQGKQ